MPKFTDVTQEIHAPWWGEKEVVEIRKFGYVDRKYLAMVYATIIERLREEGALPPEPETDEERARQLGELAVPPELVAQFNAHTILRGVRRWTDADGVYQPVTMEMVEQLEDEDGDFILGAITDLNPRRTEKERATFRGGDGAGGEERDLSG